jgi:hypothetical protein
MEYQQVYSVVLDSWGIWLAISALCFMWLWTIILDFVAVMGYIQL